MLLVLAQDAFTHAYDNTTTISVSGAFALALLTAGMIGLPRRLTVVPMVLAACFIPVAQRIAIFSLDFTILRIVIVTGWVRVMMRGEYRQLKWKPIDILIVAWGISGTLIYVVQQGSPDALVYKSGVGLDSLGLYFLLRILLRDWHDVRVMVGAIAALTVPIFFSFLAEFITGRNAFSVFGGVPATTLVREGRLRCQGAFSHSILAGCFFGSLIPIYFAYFIQKGHSKILPAFCLFACFAIIYMCGSATPLMATMGACLGVAFFWVRAYMRPIRWGILCGIIVLHMVMKAPVWSLIERVDVVGGSTGWHRYHLINAAIAHFGEWWLIGTRSTGQWGYFLFDVANQYILEGVEGGLLTLICFIAILVAAFRGVGRMCREAKLDRDRQLMAWALGSSLFAHCMAFIGVSYFGQMNVIWYLLLATIGSLTPGATQATITVRSKKPSRKLQAADMQVMFPSLSPITPTTTTK